MLISSTHVEPHPQLDASSRVHRFLHLSPSPAPCSLLSTLTAMSYWFGPDAADATSTIKKTNHVHVPSHNPCDWTNPIVPKRRAFPPGYVAPGERLRRIAAALDAEFDEKEQLKVIGGVQQGAEWFDKSQQRMRSSINKRADVMSATPLHAVTSHSSPVLPSPLTAAVSSSCAHSLCPQCPTGAEGVQRRAVRHAQGEAAGTLLGGAREVSRFTHPPFSHSTGALRTLT